jgi:hypothetical protein
VERLIGTMRREFLDHVLFWNDRDLERKLAEFQAYYNAARCHASLDGHTPLSFVGRATALMLAKAGTDVAITFRSRQIDAERTVS